MIGEPAALCLARLDAETRVDRRLAPLGGIVIGTLRERFVARGNVPAIDLEVDFKGNAAIAGGALLFRQRHPRMTEAKWRIEDGHGQIELERAGLRVEERAGIGGVGRAMAKRAAGFPMTRYYHDPRRLDAAEEAALGLTWLPFDELLARVDYLSLHVNLNAKTRHLIGARELALMKPTAFVINTARGPIIDEDALIAALQARRIAGAALDVFEHEPGIHPVLLGLPNVVVTAHMGSAVDSLREAMAAVAVDNILEALNGRPAPNCWNPEVYSVKV